MSVPTTTTSTTATPASGADATPSTAQRLAAEAIGTFILVFGVIGTALFAAAFGGGEGGLGVGFLGVSIALGLSVVAAASAFGGISGGHFNPAVTIGLAAAGRTGWRDVTGYLLAQLVGAMLATTALVGVLAGGPGYDPAALQGVSTGWGPLSPGGFDLGAAMLTETIATAVLVAVILGVTGPRGPQRLAPLAIGSSLTALALVAIPVSNASFNPARSIATAIYGGPEAIGQVWLSIAAPILGAVLAGLAHRFVFDRPLTDPART
ncbi:aquaporin [Agromyces sp. LHK192]|uniref:aquaporin n=1 Tax=Agromyces sp. LHK192 TaxID=2498704 RepID=UPI000FDA4F07|nr:aquaporin [Agromyces sp. LHK192]